MTENQFDRLDALMNKTILDHTGTIAVRLTNASERGTWRCELRWTPEPHRTDGGDRSFVLFATGGKKTPDIILKRLLDELEDTIERGVKL